MTKETAGDRALRERAMPHWYQWMSVTIPGLIAILTCVNRFDEFGLSAWLTNFIVLFICIAGMGFVTYVSSNFASINTLVGTIVLGSLAIAALSNILPVIATSYGSLWAGCGLGFMIGLTLTAGEQR